MVEEILDPLDVETGVFVKDNKEQIEHLAGIANQIRDEFAKISKHKLLGQSIQEILEVELYILDNTEKPKYNYMSMETQEMKWKKYVEKL